MTEINFYVSDKEGLENRFKIVHRLIKLARLRKMTIYVFTDDLQTSEKLSTSLWTNEANSFLSHSLILNDSKAPNCSELNSIYIFHADEHKEFPIFEPLHNCDYLINLSSLGPTFFSRFVKMAEVIDSNKEILTAGRKRYSFYRDRGYTLGYHKL